jgi:NAD(P)-dependent dehydrogenase (short-subunit alcohol dehydrogenase family)
MNVVGVYSGGTPAHETSLEDWDYMFDANLRSALVASRAVALHMLEKSYGKIVNVGSRNALSGAKNAAAYSAAKGALLRLTESMAAELKAGGVNVNCVLPGTIDTPQNRAAMPNADYNRWVQPEAIADVMLFLASDAARALHGVAIPVF